jgi:hypothetical protein
MAEYGLEVLFEPGEESDGADLESVTQSHIQILAHDD